MKKLLSIVLGILLVGGTAFAAQQWVRDANPFHVFQAIKVTSNGALSGDCFFQAQNGVVSDCQGNNFLTGVIGDFLPLSGNTITMPMSGDIYMDNNRSLYWGDIYTFIQADDITPEMNMVVGEGFGGYLKGGINLLHNQVNLFIKQGANILYGVSLGNTGALTYNDDYSTHFVDRSLIDKGYADDTYLTGFTETDPIWNSVSGNYVPYSGATQNLYLANNNIIFDQGNVGGIIFSSGGSTFNGSTIMSFANNQLSFAGPDYGVNFDMSLLNSNITAYFPPVSGTFLFDTTLSGYLTGYIPRTSIDTGFNNTGSDTIVASEKATYQQILSMISAQGWSTSGNIGTAGMVFGMTNDYRLQFIMSGQNAGYIDSIGGNRNTFYGALAGDSASTAQNNVGIGFGALTNSSAGNRNACVGYLCLNQNTNGTDNSCVGVYCMQSNNGGSYNSSIGNKSLQNNIDGDFNTAIGMSAGNSQTGGDYNVYLGQGADSTGSNISYSSAIGHHAKVRTSHMMQLGDIGLTRLTTRANVGIGKLEPTQALDVSGVVKGMGFLVKSGMSMIPATADTGDRWRGTSGTEFVFLNWSGGQWNVKYNIAP